MPVLIEDCRMQFVCHIKYKYGASQNIWGSEESEIIQDLFETAPSPSIRRQRPTLVYVVARWLHSTWGMLVTFPVQKVQCITLKTTHTIYISDRWSKWEQTVQFPALLLFTVEISFTRKCIFKIRNESI